MECGEGKLIISSKEGDEFTFLTELGNDFVLSTLYHRYRRYLSCPSKVAKFHRSAEKEGIVDANTKKDLDDWFGKLCEGDSSREDIFQFKTLLTTSLTPPNFRRLSLYHSIFLSHADDEDGVISLRSSDHVVLEMKKSAARTQSVVLRNHSDFIGFAGINNDEDEIPVQVPFLPLSKLISFCKKNHKFNSIIEGAVQQLMGPVNLLKRTVHAYKTWITRFIKSNKPLFSHLHQAADYLHIPALLELTTKAVGDMKESSVQDIADWYAGLSISRMLSPLGIQAYSTLSQLDFFS